MKPHLALVVLSFLATTGGELAAAPPDDGHDDNKPVELSLGATYAPPNLWQGQVAGAFPGTVKAELSRSRKTDTAWDLNCTWTVDAGKFSFVAHLSGAYSLVTGKVTMNGVVTDGYRKGTRAHLKAQLVSIPSGFPFTGTFRIGGDDQGEGDQNDKGDHNDANH